MSTVIFDSPPAGLATIGVFGKGAAVAGGRLGSRVRPGSGRPTAATTGAGIDDAWEATETEGVIAEVIDSSARGLESSLEAGGKLIADEEPVPEAAEGDGEGAKDPSAACANTDGGGGAASISVRPAPL